MPGPASSASRNSVLIGVTCDTTNTVSPPCSAMIRAARPPHPIGDAVEALPLRGCDAGVAQPEPVQLRIAFGGLTESQPFPAPEVGFDQIVVDGDIQPERLSRRRRGVICPLQR